MIRENEQKSGANGFMLQIWKVSFKVATSGLCLIVVKIESFQEIRSVINKYRYSVVLWCSWHNEVSHRPLYLIERMLSKYYLYSCYGYRLDAAWNNIFLS